MSFHYSGPFTNTKAKEHWSFYSLSGAPSNVYDGHYNYTYSINENAINSSGTRQIHMLEMSLSKSIEGSTLLFSGSVKNLESHGFNGFMLVFGTENQLVDPSYPTITWNFVFRDYGLNKTLSLPGLSTDTFSGTWNIQSGVNTANIQVIAAVYDVNTRDPTYGWQYAVQSVCDVCGHSVAVPEFPNMWTLLFFRSDKTTVNGLYTEKLLGSQSGVAGYKTRTDIDPELLITREYWGIRVFKRSSSGIETEITNPSDDPVARVYRGTTSEGMQYNTWNLAYDVPLLSTDSLVIKVYTTMYYPEEGFYTWQLQGTWTTQRLGVTKLGSATWTIYYYTYWCRIKHTGYVSLTSRFYYDTTKYNSHIEGITY